MLFPHHENERAQSLCALPGAGFARVWLHNGMLLSEGEKMSKSLGNFVTIKDALALAPGEAVRAALLRAQYRSTLEFGQAAMAEARGEMDRFYRALQRAPEGKAGIVPGAVLEALCDDLNTPAAFAAMHGLADRAMQGDGEAAAGLRAAGGAVGAAGAVAGGLVSGRGGCRGGGGGDCRADCGAAGAGLRASGCDPGGVAGARGRVRG